MLCFVVGRSEALERFVVAEEGMGKNGRIRKLASRAPLRGGARAVAWKLCAGS
jgi:hypothetical protein